MTVTIEDIRRGVSDLELVGLPLCVHSSLRSFGRVEGGALTLVQGLLEEGCTVVVPTFSWAFAVPPPPNMRPERNGADYSFASLVAPPNDRIYTPQTNELDREDMGAVPAAVLACEGRSRGNHPLSSLAGIGPLAAELISGQAPLDIYAPFRALAERDGWVLLMGVGLRRMTLLHLAERMAGRTLFRRWANGPDGQPMMVEVGGCSEGFEKFEPLLAPLERRTTVGESVWRAFPARGTLEVASEAIRQDPWITHCGRTGCRCNDAVLGGPILSGNAPSET